MNVGGNKMAALITSKARRPLVLAIALTATLALFAAIAPGADATKPDQILDAEVRSVNQATCEVTIDTMLNTRGSMKNDIRVTVFGAGGFERELPARRGATLRVKEQLGGPGFYSAQVTSVNPRTGETAQTMSLPFIVCG
jgi:hypothetical protein